MNLELIIIYLGDEYTYSLSGDYTKIMIGTNTIPKIRKGEIYLNLDEIFSKFNIPFYPNMTYLTLEIFNGNLRILNETKEIAVIKKGKNYSYPLDTYEGKRPILTIIYK